MSTIIGFVEKLSVKTGDGKFGPWAAYSAKIQTADGTILDPWFQFGFKKPPIEEGDWIEFKDKEATFKDGTVSTSARAVIEGTASKPKNAPARPAGTQTVVTPGKLPLKSSGRVSELFGEIGGYYSEDDIGRITWAGVRKDAVALVGSLLEHDALPMSKSSAKAGTAKRYDEILAMVDKLTVRMFFDNATLRLVETVDDEGAVDIEVDLLPENDEEVPEGNGVDSEEAEEEKF